VSPFEERLVVASPAGDFERLFCHVIPLQDRECGDLILTTAKISIYLTKPLSHSLISIKFHKKKNKNPPESLYYSLTY
jgi:hypothetical protein